MGVVDTVLRFFVGTRNERLVRSMKPKVDEIVSMFPETNKLTDDELKAKTAEFKNRLRDGATLDDLLVEAFACVREASWRMLGGKRWVTDPRSGEEIPYKAHFPVQLMGGMVLHQGMISEMVTGEGKTFVATLAAYLNALDGRGVHVITVNDYLARRDAEEQGRVLGLLGMTCGWIQSDMDNEERRAMYGRDVTYGTNNEFGFDYLRDNMKFRLQDYVQRPYYYAIVDEVDSILIDEARTPLIISGPTEESTDKYYKIQQLIHGLGREIRREEVSKLSQHEVHDIREDWEQLEDKDVVREGDYAMDEKSRAISLTEQGSHLLEERLRKAAMLGEGSLFDFEQIEVLHHVNQALKAHYLFKRDVDYVVNEGKVVIVDEFTGRLMPGRRFSDGLHQALEAKEGVTIERESQTYASITFQNYFRMYEKLAGMTGTAKTEEEEFKKIYGMPVAVIPTNRPMIRDDQADVIYKTRRGKLRAVVEDIRDINETGQPVLVGTISIETSEEFSRALKQVGVAHTVLNAKYHEQEAEIIAGAGERGRVTIATNMAGRGTDIKLGEGVVELGGLFIFGTERHESRRIDNQLRGRAGRQGDPGASRFYLSLEDDLMRIFGGERIANLMTRLRVEEDEAITHVLISRAIENAQKKVEGHNFELRKHVLEYDDVMNRQREIIYGRRREILGGDVEDTLLDMADEVVEDMVGLHIAGKHVDQWDVEGLRTQFQATFGMLPSIDWDDRDISAESIRDALVAEAEQIYRGKRAALRALLESVRGTPPSDEEVDGVYADFGRQVLLSINDAMWKDHLLSMDYLREGIGLVGYAQKKPIDEYKREGFEMFTDLMFRISKEATSTFFRAQFGSEVPKPVQREEPKELSYTHGEEPAQKPRRQPVRKVVKLGRNDKCHCGSGKKYKNCHMRLEQQSGHDPDAEQTGFLG